MDTKDATTVIKIMMTADGGCGHCVSYLLHQFIKEFPEYKDLTNEIWRTEFANDLGEEDY